MKKQLNKTIRRSGMWVPLQRWDRLEECEHFCHVVWIWNLQEFYAKCITFTHALRNWYSKVKWLIFQLVMFYDDTHYFFHRSLDYNWRQIYEIGWYIYVNHEQFINNNNNKNAACLACAFSVAGNCSYLWANWLNKKKKYENNELKDYSGIW